ncbi:MAG TPA: hypothetical protein VLJ42_04285 [Solirubrobacteraceae bacterium]|nr:hypothetical protein [Solirubrobacteraceae bacterium]
MPTASASAARSARAAKTPVRRPAARRSAAAGAGRPRRVGTTRAHARVQWDRLGRIALLLVSVALIYMYLSAGMSLLSTWHTARHASATVAAMERQNELLQARHAALGRRGTLEAEARRLGMMRPGEQSYFVRNLPAN